MVALNTPQAELGFQAPDFSLKNIDNKFYSLDDLKGENGLLIMFICNHCPFVKAIFDKIIRDCSELKQYGINSVAIMSNDVNEYVEDSFENMQKIAQSKNFLFPYLIDETQNVAKSYGAVCTPDFFGFDKNLQLKYRGRLDDSGMNNKEDGVRELFNAMVDIAKIGEVSVKQNPSIGCSIKWKE